MSPTFTPTSSTRQCSRGIGSCRQVLQREKTKTTQEIHQYISTSLHPQDPLSIKIPTSVSLSVFLHPDGIFPPSVLHSDVMTVLSSNPFPQVQTQQVTADDIGAAVVYLQCQAAALKAAPAAAAAATTGGNLTPYTLASSSTNPKPAASIASLLVSRIEWSTLLAVRLDLKLGCGKVLWPILKVRVACSMIANHLGCEFSGPRPFFFSIRCSKVWTGSCRRSIATQALTSAPLPPGEREPQVTNDESDHL